MPRHPPRGRRASPPRTEESRVEAHASSTARPADTRSARIGARSIPATCRDESRSRGTPADSEEPGCRSPHRRAPRVRGVATRAPRPPTRRRPSATTVWAAVSGVIAAGAFLAAAELAAVFAARDASPILAVGAFVIDIVPQPLKEFAIAAFGSAEGSSCSAASASRCWSRRDRRRAGAAAATMGVGAARRRQRALARGDRDARGRRRRSRRCRRWSARVVGILVLRLLVRRLRVSPAGRATPAAYRDLAEGRRRVGASGCRARRHRSSTGAGSSWSRPWPRHPPWSSASARGSRTPQAPRSTRSGTRCGCPRRGPP